MAEIFRKTTNIPKRYLTKSYKSPVILQEGEYNLKKTTQKANPDSNTLALMQKLREAEQEKANSKKKKKRKS